mmetsp:Transcript_35323/g.43252  ORF Transcript_35323/g.43252 Transcript_35323/m.43252 type:complete len:87 (-) Transcript_35323:65-325(-)
MRWDVRVHNMAFNPISSLFDGDDVKETPELPRCTTLSAPSAFNSDESTPDRPGMHVAKYDFGLVLSDHVLLIFCKSTVVIKIEKRR